MAGHIRKLGPNRYQGRYLGPDGHERSKIHRRKVDAQRWLDTQGADLARGAWVDPQRSELRFSDWVAIWESTLVDLRPTTLALNLGVVRNHLLPRFGRFPLSRISTSDVQAMVAADINEGRLSNSAIRRHVIVLRPILKAAMLDDRLGRNPCDGVKLPPEDARDMRVLEPAEVIALADAISPAHYRLLILTAAYAGLRWGELAGLRAERVNLLRRQIRVEEQLLEVGGRLWFGPPKTKASVRTVSIPASLADLLGPHLGSTPVRQSGLAFPTPSGVPMRRGNFGRTLRRARMGAGFDPPPPRRGEFPAPILEEDWPLRGLVFHELRHTAVALAIAQGAHPVAIKDRMGHSSITVTMDRYGGLFPRLDETIAEGLDGVLARSIAQREVG